MSAKEEAWPTLDWNEWHETADMLHMIFQIVGKTRLALTPMQNHWWNVPLYLTARGLSTLALALADTSQLDIELDFIDHRVVFRKSSGQVEHISITPRPVADFYASYLGVLRTLGVPIAIDSLPVEVSEPVRFDRDVAAREYDASAAHRFWRVLTQANRLLKAFSTGFYGKTSPVHFFWGSMDLAVTRFNGRRAPERPGADAIQREAYSHECISAGFWAGNGGYGKAAFYAYAAPVPPGLADTRLPGPGSFNKDLGEFLLDYDDVRGSADPDRTAMQFLDDTYSAAATSCGWDRTNLDRVAP